MKIKLFYGANINKTSGGALPHCKDNIITQLKTHNAEIHLQPLEVYC